MVTAGIGGQEDYAQECDCGSNAVLTANSHSEQKQTPRTASEQAGIPQFLLLSQTFDAEQSLCANAKNRNNDDNVVLINFLYFKLKKGYYNKSEYAVIKHL